MYTQLLQQSIHTQILKQSMYTQILKQSGMMRVADDDHDGKDEIEDLDLNAPPDVLAILSDGSNIRQILV